MLKYMLDTNICIFTIKHKPPHVREAFSQDSDQQSRPLAQKCEASQWVEENQAAITSYNEFVEQHGCFGDEFREF